MQSGRLQFPAVLRESRKGKSLPAAHNHLPSLQQLPDSIIFVTILSQSARQLTAPETPV